MENTKEKKELGSWGEKTLDYWMTENNWNPINKNLRIKKGEIDRVYYQKNLVTQENKFCITEVKTSVFYTKKDIEILFTETGIKRYLKARQVRNLYRCGENLIALLQQKKIPYFNVYLRFFIIFKYVKPNLSNINFEKLPKSPAIKNCFVGENYLIFSIEPEFTRINARKSLLQVSVY